MLPCGVLAVSPLSHICVILKNLSVAALAHCQGRTYAYGPAKIETYTMQSNNNPGPPKHFLGTLILVKSLWDVPTKFNFRRCVRAGFAMYCKTRSQRLDAKTFIAANMLGVTAVRRYFIRSAKHALSISTDSALAVRAASFTNCLSDLLMSILRDATV